jgi:hypothetical protein
MGENYMCLYPADPESPKPDWPRLRGQLLERGFMRDPMRRRHDWGIEAHLWERIVSDRGQRHAHGPDSIGNFNHFFEGLKSLGLVPKEFTADCGALDIDQFVALLKHNGWISAGFTFPATESFLPGPRFWELSGMPGGLPPGWRSDTEIYFEDFGDDFGLAFSVESLFAPPAIPGTDRVCEDWQDLMSRWYEDPSQQWIDPETGKGYGIPDLDWNHTLAAARCWLEIHTPQVLDANRAATLLTELTGQEFRYAYHDL